MGRGTTLTLEERGKILAYHDSKLTTRQIAEKIGRSQSVVSHFIRNPSSYGKNMHKPTRKALTTSEERRILREASNSTCSAVKIRQNLGVNASIATVRRVIRKAKHLKRLKLKKSHHLPMFVSKVAVYMPAITWHGIGSGIKSFFLMKNASIWMDQTAITITSMI